jgi:hypothetical protein
MGLIKKSVSDIERKTKYARYVMRVLKECKMVHDFIDYTNTDNYRVFRNNYMEKHGTTDVWYDCRTCGEILGAVNFEYYYYRKGEKAPYNTYALLLAYLALFDEEEYEHYCSVFGHEKYDNARVYIIKFLRHNVYNISIKDIDIVNKWIKEREILYGSENLFD